MQVFITFYCVVAELERYMYVVGWCRRGGCAETFGPVLFPKTCVHLGLLGVPYSDESLRNISLLKLVLSHLSPIFPISCFLVVSGID